jgi:hypothetical protein
VHHLHACNAPFVFDTYMWPRRRILVVLVFLVVGDAVVQAEEPRGAVLAVTVLTAAAGRRLVLARRAVLALTAPGAVAAEVEVAARLADGVVAPGGAAIAARQASCVLGHVQLLEVQGQQIAAAWNKAPGEFVAFFVPIDCPVAVEARPDAVHTVLAGFARGTLRVHGV